MKRSPKNRLFSFFLLFLPWILLAQGTTGECILVEATDSEKLSPQRGGLQINDKLMLVYAEGAGLEGMEEQQALQMIREAYEQSKEKKEALVKAKRSGKYFAHICIETWLPSDRHPLISIGRRNDRLTTIQFYRPARSGRLERVNTSGSAIPLKDKVLPVWENYFELPAASGRKIDLFFYLEGEINMDATIPIFLVDRRSVELEMTNSISPGLIGIFHGSLWVQILFFLLLYFIAREKIELYYVVLLLGVSLFFFFWKDLVHIPLIPSMSEENARLLSNMSQYLAIFGLIKFSATYLKAYEFLPGSRKWINIYLFLIAAPALAFTIFGILNGNYLSKLTVWRMAALLGLIISFAMGILVFRKKFAKARNYLLAMVVPLFAGVIYTVISIFGNEDIYGIATIIFRIGILFTLFFFALDTGYRTYLLKVEKLRAQRLKELDVAKSNLYTNITHEFRTPLTVIMGMTDQILGNDKEKNLIHRNSRHLLNLINQMLDLAKLENGTLKLNLIQGDVIPFLRYLTESFQSFAESKEVALTFSSEVESLEMDYDAEKLQQIISNLLSNAIKFTPKGGEVVVSGQLKVVSGQLNRVSSSANLPLTTYHLQLTVQDTGIGIPKEDLEHIFDRFYQVDDSSTRKSGGTGIGLALAKELVYLMRGDIRVESTVGRGTEFVLLIPIENEAPKVDSLEKIESTAIAEAIQQGKTIGNVIEEAALLPGNAEEGVANLPLALLVEDNRDVAEYLQSCLKDQYRYEWAANGQEGIDKAIEIVPDIIISDVMMPEKDGYEVCKALKEDTRTSHIPIVLLTAKATTEDRLTGLRRGADAYLTKPFNKEELFIRLDQLIEVRRKLRERYSNIKEGDLPPPEEEYNQEDSFIQSLREAVEANLSDEDFGITELCRSVNLSRTQVHRKLKALTGKSASAFIRSIRLNKAKTLLLSSDLTVSEIAYDVGFHDPNYFSRTFNDEFGMPPSAIRK